MKLDFELDESIKVAFDKFKDYSQDLFDLFAKKAVKKDGYIVIVEKITLSEMIRLMKSSKIFKSITNEEQPFIRSKINGILSIQDEG